MSKKVVLLIGLIVVFSFSASASLMDISAAYVSRYIFRGYDSNGAQPAIQPQAIIYLGDSGFNVGLWGNYNIGDSYGGAVNKEFTEIDYTLTYASDIGEDWSYSVYYSRYTYPLASGPLPQTGEIFCSVTRNNIPMSPTLTYSYDIDQGKGSYVSLCSKTSFPASAQKIDCGLTVGYDGGQYGAKPGISDANLTLSAVIAAGKVDITPCLNYLVVNKDSRPASENIFWLSVCLASSY